MTKGEITGMALGVTVAVVAVALGGWLGYWLLGLTGAPSVIQWAGAAVVGSFSLSASIMWIAMLAAILSPPAPRRRR